jgi:hypothetical protein
MSYWVRPCSLCSKGPMVLPITLVRKYHENDPVEVIIDPSSHDRSVLQIEM